MPDLDYPEFARQMISEARAGRVDAAVAAIRQRIRDAEAAANEDDGLALYSVLLDVYALTRGTDKTLEVRAERAAKYPRNLDVKMADVETLVWVNRDYRRAIVEADQIMAGTPTDSLVHHKSITMKGLCYLELGETTNAAEMLKRARYYDLTLVERLIARGSANPECHEFLVRARETYQQYLARGQDVSANLAKIDALLAAGRSTVNFNSVGGDQAETARR